MDFDSNDLRVFCQVVSDGSFSGAARTLKIAQPTVSQRVAKLEADLGGRIFERVGREVHLTELGRELHGFASESLDRTQAFEDRIHRQRESPEGVVRYAMPESCQWTPHFRQIMSRIAHFPRIRFEIAIAPSEQIVQGILRGDHDFGFIVGERLSSELRFEKFADESYSAVAADGALLRPLSERRFEEARFISYPGWELFLETWARSVGVWKQIQAHRALPSVRIGTLAGAIHAAQEGAGIAVLPSHCVVQELKRRSLFEHPVKKPAPSCPIHIARRAAEKLPRRAELVLEMLRQAKRERG